MPENIKNKLRSGSSKDTIETPNYLSRRQDISTAPRDGSIIRLFSKEVRVMGVQGMWRVTRQLLDGRWMKTALWVSPVNLKPISGAKWTEWEQM